MCFLLKGESSLPRPVTSLARQVEDISLVDAPADVSSVSVANKDIDEEFMDEATSAEVSLQRF